MQVLAHSIAGSGAGNFQGEAALGCHLPDSRHEFAVSLRGFCPIILAGKRARLMVEAWEAIRAAVVGDDGLAGIWEIELIDPERSLAPVSSLIAVWSSVGFTCVWVFIIVGLGKSTPTDNPMPFRSPTPRGGKRNR